MVGRKKGSPKRQIKPRHFTQRPCQGLKPTKQNSYSEMKPNLSPSKLSLSHFPFSFTPCPCKSKKLQRLRVKEGKKQQRKKKSPLKVTNEKQSHLPWAKNSLETDPLLLNYSLLYTQHSVPCPKEWKQKKTKNIQKTFKRLTAVVSAQRSWLSVPSFCP